MLRMKHKRITRNMCVARAKPAGNAAVLNRKSFPEWIFVSELLLISVVPQGITSQQQRSSSEGAPVRTWSIIIWCHCLMFIDHRQLTESTSGGSEAWNIHIIEPWWLRCSCQCQQSEECNAMVHTYQLFVGEESWRSRRGLKTSFGVKDMARKYGCQSTRGRQRRDEPSGELLDDIIAWCNAKGANSMSTDILFTLWFIPYIRRHWYLNCY